jgi:D-3-phosphoglycerate dehydrogenase
MLRFKVLIIDYAWPDVEIERRTLTEVDAELIVAPKEKQDVAGLAALAKEHHVEAIMTNWAKVPQQVIEASPECQILSRLGIGLDNIDVAYCTGKNFPVANVLDYCLIEVAEHALALLLALLRKVVFYHQATNGGRYELQAGPKLRRIEGQTLGIVG